MRVSKLSLVLFLLLLLYGLAAAVEAERKRQEEAHGEGYGGRTRRKGYYGGDEEEEEEEDWWREREREREMERRERQRREWEREQRERERGRSRREEEEEEEEGEDYFLLGNRERVFQTEAGEMKVVKSFGGGGKIVDKPMHIGFITMEPQTLFIPQYLDSNLILFVRRGDAKLGLIYEDDLVERRLKIGDIYRIPAGSAFYLVNVGEGQRLHIICSIDTSESLGLRNFQSFFLGGGTYPASVLKGFDLETLATAFNVTREEVGEFLTVQQEGPVVFVPEADVPTVWSNFLEMKDEEKLQYLKEIVELHGGQSEAEEEKQGAWSWWSFFKSIFKNDGKDGRKEREREREEHEREGEREERPVDPRGDRPGRGAREREGEEEERPVDPRGDRRGQGAREREGAEQEREREGKEGDPRWGREEQPYDPRGDRPGERRGEREERPHDPRGDRPDERRRERRGERRGWKWRTGKGPDSYNLYDRKPDFRNNYGWSVALHGKDYEPLHHSGIGVYLVNLTAGSMMAPHVNPTATEYGVILRGTGTIQIGYPDGTPAMNKQVREGDVFWVPRYFPFCQIASRSGPMEFFGFTTSAHRNRPQFLAGSNSVFQTLRGPELATAFGFGNISDMADFLDAQREAVILPTPSAAPPEIKMRSGEEKPSEEDADGAARIQKAAKALGKEMMMGF